ncbi:kinase-like domain-containing protein [Amylocystis lapponica]|nr:kinase-like domain-containing protein [Amylocystis lapponica]
MCWQARGESVKRFSPAGSIDLALGSRSCLVFPESAYTQWSVSRLTTVDGIPGAGTFGSVLAVHARHRPSAQFAVKAVNKRRICENETALANWSPDIARHRRSEECMILAWLPWNPFFNGLIDVFADERNLYYMLKLAPAGSLDLYLLTNGPVSAAAAQFYFANIVLGLEFLHSHDIAHRDLKPGNSWDVDAGTHEYQMPELLREESLPRDKCTAVDWWAAAVCLYKMFSQEVVRLSIFDLLTGMWGAERFGSRTHKAASDEIPLNYELCSHEWTRDLKWSKITQRREVAPFVPAPYPDMHEGSYDMPQQWTIPGLKRAPNQHHHCIDKDC